jgi:hypothetical protein
MINAITKIANIIYLASGISYRKSIAITINANKVITLTNIV